MNSNKYQSTPIHKESSITPVSKNNKTRLSPTHSNSICENCSTNLMNGYLINRNQINVSRQNRSSVSDNSSVLSCELSVSNNLIDYGLHSLILGGGASSACSGGAASSSGYESMNRDSNDSDNTSTSSKTKSSKFVLKY